MKLSFIIPVYNGAELITKCLNSLENQNIPSSNYEIICIDDCSIDNSLDVLFSYAKKHSNVRVIHHEKNLRVASACNTGLQIASGDYVWFVGQDDWIKENCLKRLFRCLTEDNLDILLFNYNRVNSSGQIQNFTHVFDDMKVQTGLDLVRNRFGNTYTTYLLGYEWRAVFRRSLLLENQISFPDGLNFEDTLILIQSLSIASRVSAISDYLYNYRINETSIMYNFEKIKKGALIYEFSFIIGKAVEDYAVCLSKLDCQLGMALTQKAQWYYNYFVLDLVRTDLKQKSIFYNLVENNKDDIRNIKHKLGRMARLLLSPIGKPLSCAMAVVYSFKKIIGNFLCVCKH